MSAKIYNLNKYRKKKERDNIVQLYKEVDRKIVEAYKTGMCDICGCVDHDILKIGDKFLCYSCARM